MREEDLIWSDSNGIEMDFRTLDKLDSILYPILVYKLDSWDQF